MASYHETPEAGGASEKGGAARSFGGRLARRDLSTTWDFTKSFVYNHLQVSPGSEACSRKKPLWCVRLGGVGPYLLRRRGLWSLENHYLRSGSGGCQILKGLLSRITKSRCLNCAGSHIG